MKKRIISFVLTVLMLLSTIPLWLFQAVASESAENESADYPTQQNSTIYTATFISGDKDYTQTIEADADGNVVCPWNAAYYSNMFSGWKRDGDDTLYSVGDVVKITEDTTFVGQTHFGIYTVPFLYFNGEEIVEIAVFETTTDSKQLIAPAMPKKEGYTFKGWTRFNIGGDMTDESAWKFYAAGAKLYGNSDTKARNSPFYAVYEPTGEHVCSVNKVVVPGDCTTAEITYEGCECGRFYEYVSDVVPGHDYGAYTDNGDGTQSASCSKCNHEITKKIYNIPNTLNLYAVGDSVTYGKKSLTLPQQEGSYAKYLQEALGISGYVNNALSGSAVEEWRSLITGTPNHNGRIYGSLGYENYSNMITQIKNAGIMIFTLDSNDVFNKVPGETIEEWMYDFIEAAHAINPDCLIVFIGASYYPILWEKAYEWFGYPDPSQQKNYNTERRKLLAEVNARLMEGLNKPEYDYVYYIDISELSSDPDTYIINDPEDKAKEDGVHPGKAGYENYVDFIIEALGYCTFEAPSEKFNVTYKNANGTTIETVQMYEGFNTLASAPNTLAETQAFQGWSDGETLYKEGGQINIKGDTVLTAVIREMDGPATLRYEMSDLYSDLSTVMNGFDVVNEGENGKYEFSTSNGRYGYEVENGVYIDGINTLKITSLVKSHSSGQSTGQAISIPIPENVTADQMKYITLTYKYTGDEDYNNAGAKWRMTVNFGNYQSYSIYSENNAVLGEWASMTFDLTKISGNIEEFAGKPVESIEIWYYDAQSLKNDGGLYGEIHDATGAEYHLALLTLSNVAEEVNPSIISYENVDSPIASAIANYGIVTLAEAQVRENDRFAGWSDGAHTLPASSTYIASANITLQADWVPKKNHTVTLVKNNGESNENAQVYTENTYTLPQEPTREGYAFRGWSDGTTVYRAGTVLTIISDLTFNAVWEEIKPAVSYDITTGISTDLTLDDMYITNEAHSCVDGVYSINKDGKYTIEAYYSLKDGKDTIEVKSNLTQNTYNALALISKHNTDMTVAEARILTVQYYYTGKGLVGKQMRAFLKTQDGGMVQALSNETIVANQWAQVTFNFSNHESFEAIKDEYLAQTELFFTDTPLAKSNANYFYTENFNFLNGETYNFAAFSYANAAANEATVTTVRFFDGTEEYTSLATTTATGSVKLPAAQTKEGYTFLGWSCDDGVTVLDALSTITVSSDTVFKAVWKSEETETPDPDTPQTFTVIFKNGEETVEALENKTSEDNITLLPAYAKEGHLFLGWSNGTTTFAAGSVVNVDKNTTFSARYSPMDAKEDIKNISSNILTTLENAFVQDTVRGYAVVNYSSSTGAITGTGKNDRFTQTLTRDVTYDGKTTILLKTDAFDQSGNTNAAITIDMTAQNKTVADFEKIGLSYYYAPLGSKNQAGQKMMVRLTSSGGTVYYVSSTETIVRDAWATASFDFTNAETGVKDAATAFDISTIATEKVVKAEIYWYVLSAEYGRAGRFEAAVGDKLYFENITFSSPAVPCGEYQATFKNDDAVYALSQTDAGVLLPQAPSGNEGLTFKGWSNGAVMYDASTVVNITKDTEFVAVWQENTGLNPEVAHSVTFKNNLTFNYYIGEESVAGFENLRLEIEMDKYDKDGTHTVIEAILYPVLTADGYKFSYSGISAPEAGNQLRATLYASADGEEFFTELEAASVKSYAYSRLQNSTDDSFKTLLVDMLNYCAAAQTYFGIRTDALVNSELGEYASYGTQNDASVSDTSSYTALAGATASIYGKSVVFGSNVEIKLYFKFDENLDTSSVKAKLTYGGKTIYIPYSEMGYDSTYGAYTVKISDIPAAELRDDVEIVLVDGETEISDKEIYNIETYVYNRINNSESESFKALLRALMKYSDSAKIYFS